MARHSIAVLASGTAAVLFVGSLSLAPVSSARAQDFLSTLFGVFGGRPFGVRPPTLPRIRPPVPIDQWPRYDAPRRRVTHADGQAYCVRGCDGRFFPAQGPDSESKARSCKSFCPASEMTLVYGSTIDDATTESGKPYSELPNAFRYRNEMVAGCTCNGKNPVGVAQVKIGADPTLRKGDIVAGDRGLFVANRSASDGHAAAANFSPLPNSMRTRSTSMRPRSDPMRPRFRHVPVVGRE